jgi:signal peptidase
MKYLKFVRNIFYYLAIILLVFVCLVTAASIFEIPGGYRFFMVESGSMEPSIKTASIILIKGANDYKVGDVVTFNANPGQPLKLSSAIVTHRIFEIKDDPQKGRLIITKGDANKTPDSEPIKKEQIIGKVVFDLPYLGYPVRFAKTQTGFIALIIIPGTLIIYGEIINIKNEIIKFIKERKRKKEINNKNKGKTKGKKKTVKKSKGDIKPKLVKTPLVLFILSFSFLTYLLPTKAYFSDMPSSKDNVISVGTWGEEEALPEIKPGDIVINEVYYDVDPAHGDDGNTASTDEWIELYNNLDREVSLQNWTISDNTDTRIIHANKKISAKGFIVIAKDAQTWTYWPSIPVTAEKIELGQIIGGGLANDGDRVILKNDKSAEIDAVSWGTDTYAFNPSVTDVAEGHSISRKIKGVDTNTAVDWMDTFLGSTPPGPNPGTNPHNEDGSLVAPKDVSEPTIIDEPAAIIEPTLIPEQTLIPEPTVIPIVEDTTIPIPTPTPLLPVVDATPQESIEPSPTLLPSASPEGIVIEPNQDV